jgi:hypothetical protein
MASTRRLLLSSTVKTLYTYLPTGMFIFRYRIEALEDSHNASERLHTPLAFPCNMINEDIRGLLHLRRSVECTFEDLANSYTAVFTDVSTSYFTRI